MYSNVFIIYELSSAYDSSATFETKSSYCPVARQSLSCNIAVARLSFKKQCAQTFILVYSLMSLCKARFKRRATAVLKANLIRSIYRNLVRHSSSTTFEAGLT